MFDGTAGPELAADVAVVDPGLLSDAEAVDLMVAAEKLRSWAAAVQYAAVARLAALRTPGPTETTSEHGPGGCSRFAVDEISAALHLSGVAAAGMLEVAVALQDLPDTRALLAAGDISTRVASVVAEEAGQLIPAQCTVLEQRLTGRTPAGVRRIVAREVLMLEPKTVDEARQEEEARRRVIFSPQPGTGMTELWAMLPAAAAEAFRQALWNLADGAKTPGDERTADQRRADTLLDLPHLADLFHLRSRFSPGDADVGRRGSVSPLDYDTEPRRSFSPVHAGADPSGSVSIGHDDPSGSVSAADDADRTACDTTGEPHRPGSHHYRRPHVQVHVRVAASTLAGLDDRPGEIDGYGPITADHARQLARDATWRRILYDPIDGTVLDVGRHTYRPPASLARHIQTRDRTCQFAGCRMPARRCHLDHTERFPDGHTAHGNLCCLCEHHHQLKHRTGWQLCQSRPGRLQWTSPTGHRYTKVPDD